MSQAGGTFTIPAGSVAPVAVAGLGFTPRGVMFKSSRPANNEKCFGNGDSTGGQLAITDDLAGGVADQTGAVIFFAGEPLTAAISSYDVDGFTITPSVNMTGSDTNVTFYAYS